MSTSGVVSGLLKRAFGVTDNPRPSKWARRECETPEVLHVFCKTAHKGKMHEVSELHTSPEHGVSGDANCKLVNPRQVLISRLEDLDGLNLLPGELRENIVIAGVPMEQLRSGTVLELASTSGHGADCSSETSKGPKLRITIECEPCGHILDRLPAKHRKPQLTVAKLAGKRGILATVVRGGSVRAGDRVEVSKKPVYDAIPGSMREQTKWVLDGKLPKGKVLTYKVLLRLIGQPAGCARALPIVLKKLRELDKQCPVWRIVDSSGKLIAQHLPDQPAKLAAEGVQVHMGAVADLDSFLWKPTRGELYEVLERPGHCS